MAEVSDLEYKTKLPSFVVEATCDNIVLPFVRVAQLILEVLYLFVSPYI